jgi:uncharacterized membrane protein
MKVLRVPWGRQLRWVTGLSLVATGVYSLVSFLRFSRFDSAGYDLGIFDQVVRQYSHFAPPYSEVKGLNFNIMGDHFHPILALLAPFYWAWDDPRMLGVAMALLIAASVFPVYLFARTRLGHWPAFTIAAGYAFWWPIQGLVAFDFHEIAVGVPLIAWIIYALDRKRYAVVSVLCLALLGVREDMGFMVMAVALIVLLRRRWKLAIVLFITGAVVYQVVTGRIIPHFNSSGDFSYWDYTGLGPTMAAAVLFILAHPLRTFGMLFNDNAKVLLWGWLFIPVGFLPLGSAYALLVAPILLSRLLSDRSGTWSTAFQYNAILAPILVMAAVDVLGRVLRRFPGRLSVLRIGAPAVFAAGAAAGIAFAPNVFPLHNLLTGQAWAYSTHMAAQQKIVNMIPSGVCVEADDRLVPHLTNRTTVGMVGRQVDYASWVAIDFSQANTGGGGDGNFTPFSALTLKESDGFREVYRLDNIVLLHRPGPQPDFCSSPFQPASRVGPASR